MISVINKRFFPVFTSLNMKKIFSKKTNIDLNEYRIKLFLGWAPRIHILKGREKKTWFNMHPFKNSESKD